MSCRRLCVNLIMLYLVV